MKQRREPKPGNPGIGKYRCRNGYSQKMLPMVASVAMGALSQKAAGSGMLDAQAQAKPSGLGGLTSFLDFDGDGSIVDDLLGIALKEIFRIILCG